MIRLSVGSFRAPNTMFFLVPLFFLCFFCFYSRKYRNPYKLVFLFGKKGSGKSCFMVRRMLWYLRRGWNVYTDMSDVKIPGVLHITVKQLECFAPLPHSAIFLDEVGISMDNRNFSKFPPGLRDFFKYQRKMKCVCYMNSQAFDVDKKVRDVTDSMALLQSIGGIFTLYRPIHRSITLVDASATGDSKIADNLRFDSIFSWRLYWMPSYFQYFNSLEMPERRSVPPQELPGSDSRYASYPLTIFLKDVVSCVRTKAESLFSGHE